LERGDSLAITIYHNPKCSTSRKALDLLQQAGHAPQVVEYLKTPPSRARMKELLAAMGMKPRDILRRSGTPYDELGLDNPALTDEQILDALEAHPILMQRPVVVSDRGTVLCRPLERIAEVADVRL
jgi:arsenate reductase